MAFDEGSSGIGVAASHLILRERGGHNTLLLLPQAGSSPPPGNITLDSWPPTVSESPVTTVCPKFKMQGLKMNAPETTINCSIKIPVNRLSKHH